MKNKIIGVIVALCFVFSFAVAIKGFMCNDEFWKVNAAQSLTLIFTVCIAFLATQFKNDERKKKDHAELLLRKIQTIVTDESFYSFSPLVNLLGYSKIITMTNRSLNNSIDILKKYAESLGFEDGAEYIAKEFKEYKEFVSEHIEDIDYLSKSESTLKKYSDNIDARCNRIILELY